MGRKLKRRAGPRAIEPTAVYRAHELPGLLQAGSRAINAEVAAGRLPCSRVGTAGGKGIRLFLGRDLLGWLDGRRQPPPPKG